MREGRGYRVRGCFQETCGAEPLMCRDLGTSLKRPVFIARKVLRRGRFLANIYAMQQRQVAT